jgi:hypothetical protein
MGRHRSPGRLMRSRRIMARAQEHAHREDSRDIGNREGIAEALGLTFGVDGLCSCSCWECDRGRHGTCETCTVGKCST